MLDRLRARGAFVWRALLGLALAAFACAALATEIGNDPLSRLAGTAAWAAGLAGAITGLVVETKRRVSQ